MGKLPGFLGTALLFWGWQTDFFVASAVMAVAIELPQIIKARWDFSDRDFERISDLSAVFLAGLTLYQFDAHGFHAIFPILAAAPFVFFPLVLAQSFSTRGEISYAALFLSIRRAIRHGRIRRVDSVDVRYPFFAICLLSASAGQRLPEVFFGGVAALTIWLLLASKVSGSRWLPWLFGVVAAFGLAFAGQLAMIKVRVSLEPLLMQLFQERLWSRRDPYRSHTAIGQIGRLKVSQRIITRVRPIGGAVVPARLRQAVYRTYSRQMWFAPKTPFEVVPSVGGGSAWDLAREIGEGTGQPQHGATRAAGANVDIATISNAVNTAATDEALGRADLFVPAQGAPFGRSTGPMIEISSILRDGRGTLMLPNATRSLLKLNVDGLARNVLGVTQVSEGPDLIEFNARFLDREVLVEGPADLDLSIPKIHHELFASLVDELGLRGRTRAEILQRVRRYFQDKFSYSLTRQRRFTHSVSPLEEFLLTTRSGHCEYFATATTLLLRAAGIPARYAAGYAVNEWSEFEQAYLVRRRHAHSWVSAYVDGGWVDVDTTPSVWMVSEEETSPWWTGSYDALAWVKYKFTQWRYSDSDWIDSKTMIGLAIVLTLILVWRLARTTRVVRPDGEFAVDRQWPGLDSELYRLEQALTDVIGRRGAGETWRTWLNRGCEQYVLAAHGADLRGGTGSEDGGGLQEPVELDAGPSQLNDTTISAERDAAPDKGSLDPRATMAAHLELLGGELLELHYRYRFDPNGLTEHERTGLRTRVERWLEDYREIAPDQVLERAPNAAWG
jgi:hypothetical protein